MDGPIYITGPFDLDMRCDWRMVGSTNFLAIGGATQDTRVDVDRLRDILRR
jgi:hypothetical protein